MWISVIWVIAALMTAHVANERGRSGWFWFFAALLVPAISLLALIALPVRRKRRAVRTAAAAPVGTPVVFHYNP